MPKRNLKLQNQLQNGCSNLFDNIVKIIEQARERVASVANSGITLMYWHIGKKINDEVLEGKRAEYGKQVVENVSVQLQKRYGTREFAVRNLRRMMQFAQLFPDLQIVSPAVTQLSWTHFILLFPLKDELQREFYITKAASERWSKRELQNHIDSALYERTVISQKPREFIKQELAKLRGNEKIDPDVVFKSTYFLDFAGLQGFFNEHDLEDCLISHLQQFLLEMGKGFSFVERKKRMIIDGDDFHLDLLFYHRKLRRLIAVDLKLGKFKAEYKGQMELYLRYLEKNDMEKGEKSPLGLLLCSEGNAEQIELLQLDKSGIKVAQYLTELPDKQRLIDEIHSQKQLLSEKLDKSSLII